MKFNDTVTLLTARRSRLRVPAFFAAAGIALASVTATGLAAPLPETPTEKRAAAETTPVIHQTRELVSACAAVPFEKITVYDDTKYSDEVELTQEGRDGVVRETCVVILEDGVETERFPIRRQILVEPVDEITTVGSLPGSRFDSRGYYIWPTTGVITSGYGPRNISKGSSNHKGIDIGTGIGTEVRAADGGEVIYSQDSGKSGYGILVKLRHDDGAVTYYAHLSKTLVAVGDRVAQGDLIALSGDTGNVTGPHLHFEIRPDGNTPVNPAGYLEGKPEKT